MKTCFPLVGREQERRHSHGPTEVYPPAYRPVESVPCGAAAACGPRDRNRSPPPLGGSREAVLGGCAQCERGRAKLCWPTSLLREGDGAAAVGQFLLQPLHPGVYLLSAGAVGSGVGQAQSLRQRFSGGAG